MAYPVVVGRTTYTLPASTGISHTIPLPTPGVDCLLIAFVRAPLATTITFSGWTALQAATGADVTDDTYAVYYKFSAGGTDASDSISVGTSCRLCAIVLAVTGYEVIATQAPQISNATNFATTANSADPTSLLPTGGSKEYLVIGFMGKDGGTVPTAAPSGYGNLTTAQSAAPSAAANCAIATAEANVTSAAPNPGAFTHPAAVGGGAAYTVVVHPLPITSVTVVMSNTGTITLSGLAPLPDVVSFPTIGGVAPLQGLAPSTRVVSPQVAVPTLTLSGLVPQIFIPIRALPSIGVVTLSGLVPTARGVKIAQPSIGVITFLGLIPLGKQGPRLPSVGVANLSGLAPVTRVVAKPSVGIATLSGLVPKGRWIVKPSIGTVTLSGLVPKGRWRFPTLPMGVVTLSGLVPTFKGVKTAQPSVASLSMQAVGPACKVRAKPSIGVVTLSGIPASFKLGMRPAIGVSTLYGLAPKATWRRATPISTNLTLSGLAPTLRLRLPASQGVVTLSGQTGPTWRFVAKPSIGVISLYGNAPLFTTPPREIITVESPLVWTR